MNKILFNPRTTRTPLWDDIWKAAAERSPNDPLQQSAFNDGCFWLMGRIWDASAEYRRLSDLYERGKPWSDNDAFLKLNRDITQAHGDVSKAVAEIIGEELMDSLWMGAPGLLVSDEMVERAASAFIEHRREPGITNGDLMREVLNAALHGECDGE